MAGGAALLQQTVDLRIGVGDLVQLVRARLARMPYRVLVRIGPHAPPEHDRLEALLLDELLDERRPFDDLDLGLNPYGSTDLLDELRTLICRLAPMSRTS